ncbi:MAG: hypothetical protein ACOYOV_00080 [Bacteroidales bacterium]
METVKKFFGYIIGGLGAILAAVFFFQKNKIDTLEKDAILAKVDKTDAVLGAKQEALQEQKAAVVQEIQAAKPAQAENLDDKAIEDYWNKK